MIDPKDFWQKLVHPAAVRLFIDIQEKHPVLIKVSGARKSKYGDFRSYPGKRKDQITVNGDMQRDAFMLTLIHEFAHKKNLDDFGRRVSAHGKEWKYCMKVLLNGFLKKDLFDPILEEQIIRYMDNWTAVTIDMPGIYKRLAQLEGKDVIQVKDIKEGEVFVTPEGRSFKRGKQLRRYFLCEEIGKKQVYKVHPLVFVEKTV